MKIFKAIKLFKKLRKRQEILYNEIVEHSTRNYLEYPKLDEYASVNKAVHILNKKIPNIYLFLFYDISAYICYLKKH